MWIHHLPPPTQTNHSGATRTDARQTLLNEPRRHETAHPGPSPANPTIKPGSPQNALP